MYRETAYMTEFGAILAHFQATTVDIDLRRRVVAMLDAAHAPPAAHIAIGLRHYITWSAHAALFAMQFARLLPRLLFQAAQI